MRTITRSTVGTAAITLVVLFAAACGSSGSHTAASQGTSTAGATAGGQGLSAPTAPAGTKVKGGTVYFTEGASAPPNYIFPMYNVQVCSVANFNQLIAMMYRPLYWYGNNYSPTVDYDYSIGEPPAFSVHDTVVTIKLKAWKWSNGETVTSRDVALWINLYKADPAKNFCGYVPGYFPDNVASVATPDPQTVVLHLTRAFNPEWFLYNELSQITPLPLAWDRTSLSQPAPTSDDGHLPDTTKAGAEAVYTFLDAQAKKLGSWATSPLWRVVDGPFRLQDFNSNGQVTLVPNPSYSGTPKPTISKLVEVPFTSDTASFNEVRAVGPSGLTIANLPPQYAPQISALKSEGYVYNAAAEYALNYFPLNLHNPTVGPIFSQLYFRQAFQHLVDQQGWIKAFLNNTANPTYSPVPPTPASPLLSVRASANPYPFSTQAAAAILAAHGWKVVPEGDTTCQKPGTGSGECGAGIKAGQPITFNVDYQSGVATIASEMQDLAAQAKKVGITLQLTSHPFDTVIASIVACQPTQPVCKWTAENWGAGWIYGPDYLPTGETLFAPGSAANYGSYSDPEATRLIQQTITGPAADEKQALTSFARYMAEQVPVVYGPTSIGTYAGDAGTLIDAKLGGYAANALGFMNPEDWYFVK